MYCEPMSPNLNFFVSRRESKKKHGERLNDKCVFPTVTHGNGSLTL